jgi:cell wall-associated NlpC family hydrolase
VSIEKDVTLRSTVQRLRRAPARVRITALFATLWLLAAACGTLTPSSHAADRREAPVVVSTPTASAAPRVVTAAHKPARKTAVRTQSTTTTASVASNPIAITLDHSLTQPQAGDSKDTLAARAKLAKAQTSYDTANQQYDQAAELLKTTQARLVKALAAAAAARKVANVAAARLVAVVQTQYTSQDPVPVAAQALLSQDGTAVLDRIQLGEQINSVEAGLLGAAKDAAAKAAAAEAVVHSEEQTANTARNNAATAQNNAAKSLNSAVSLVAKFHGTDLANFARAASNGPDSMFGAADALRAQALASGAATEKQLPTDLAPATTIALAARALLNQATGHGPKPTSGSYTPTKGTPVDEQAVMGPTPNLGGTAKYAGGTGVGFPGALTPFDGVISHANWPNAGVGTNVAGTAPFLKPNGVTVHPTLPAYPKGYKPTRAEVAVDQALLLIGSPYVWDAAGPTTFDCSGMTLWSWGHAGIALNHYTVDQAHEAVQVLPNQLLPGDLVLFGSELHHVGMYLGAGYMIDAPDTGDYVKIQKVSDDGDFAVAVRP